MLGRGERRHEKGLRNFTSIPMAYKSSAECSCSIEVRDETLEMVSTSAFIPHRAGLALRGGKKKKGRTASFEPVGHCQGEPGCVYVCLLQGRFKMPSLSFLSTIVHTMKMRPSRIGVSPRPNVKSPRSKPCTTTVLGQSLQGSKCGDGTKSA